MAKKKSKSIKSKAINVGGKTHIVESGSKAEAKYLSQGGTIGTAQDKANRRDYLKSLNDSSSSNYVDPETGLQNGKDFYGNNKQATDVVLPPTNVVNTGVLSANNQKLNFTGTSPNDYLEDPSMSIPAVTSLEQGVKNATKEKDDILQKMMDSINDTPDTAGIEEKLRSRLQIDQKQQLVTDLTGQLNGIVARGQAQQLAQVGQGRGIPEAIIGGIQAQIGRETAINALPVQAQLQAAQGNLEMANDSLDRLFKIYSDDAQNAYNARNRTYEMVYNIADKKEQRALDALKAENDRIYAEKQANISKLNEWSKLAVENGQGNLVTSFAALNPASNTFAQDFAKVQSKVYVPPKIETQTIQYGDGVALISSRTGAVIKTYPGKSIVADPKELKEIADGIKERNASIPIMQDKIDAIDVLENHKGLDSRVGPSPISRRNFAIRDAFGAGQDFAGGVHNLLTGLTLENLIAAKARGATFGALSIPELTMLAQSASKINDWEVWKKDGKVVLPGTDGAVPSGEWDIDEKNFKIELTAIQNLTRRALILSQKEVFDEDEQISLDSLFFQQGNALAPAQYY